LNINPLNNGGASFNDFPDSLINSFSSHDWTSTEVEVFTLDHVFHNQGLTSVDIIKIDVEGFEIPVIVGAIELVKVYLPDLYVEVSSNSSKVDSVLSILPSSYNAFYPDGVIYYRGDPVRNDMLFSSINTLLV